MIEGGRCFRNLRGVVQNVVMGRIGWVRVDEDAVKERDHQTPLGLGQQMQSTRSELFQGLSYVISCAPDLNGGQKAPVRSVAKV
jgi:hypothetical protein